MRSWKVNGKYPVYDDKGNVTATDITLVSDNGRYASFTEQVLGDHTRKSDTDLVALALDAYFKAEYADKAMAESVQKVDALEVAHKANEEAIASNRALAEEIKALAESNNDVLAETKAIAEAVVLANITAGFVDPTIYKRLVDLIELGEAGKEYRPYDVFTIEDTGYTPKSGEGTRVLVQVNKDFTYDGQSVSTLEGDLTNNGVLAVWHWEAPNGDA